MQFSRFRSRLLFWLRLGTVAVCSYSVFFHPYPPVYAQPGILSVTDAIQNERIAQAAEKSTQIDEHLKHTDEAMQKLTEEMSGLQGEFRSIGAVLGILNVGQIVAARKPKQHEA